MNLPIKLSSIPRSKLLILFLVVFVIFALLFGGIYYWLWFKKEPSLLVKPGEYVIVQQIDNYESPNDTSRAGYIVLGKRFTILKQQGDWLQVRVVNKEGKNPWDWWIKTSETAYQPIERQ